MGTSLLFVLSLCGASVVSCAHSSLTSATSLQQSTQCLDTCCNRSVACSETHGDSCPPGLFCKEDCCQCGRYPSDIITCNGTSSSLLNYYCATVDEDSNITLVGRCPYTDPGRNYEDHTLYHELPITSHSLNSQTCQPLNRIGALCGRCRPDHYPLAYSFKLTCILCPNIRLNWFRYIMAAYFPLTLFYFIIIFFNVNTTSSHLYAVVYYSQLMSTPYIVRMLFVGTFQEIKYSYHLVANTLESFYGIWNLDFFRPFYNDLCLGIGILPTLALDYVIAVYPLLLMITTYLLIVLYDKNYRAATVMWRPFRFLFYLLKSNWDIRTSLIDSYATFFLLSYVKFLTVSLDLLVPTKVYHLHGDHYNHTLGLFYAADTTYFGNEHLPYGILAIAVLCVFVILPTVLFALYPFIFFQKFLNLFPFRWYILHTFMDSFYGCYKDGTQPGTRDYRWFASIFFAVRISQFLLFFLIINFQYFFALLAVTVNLHAVLVVILQPFKSHYSNRIHIVFFQVINIFAFLVIMGDYSSLITPYPQDLNYFLLSGCILAAIPPLYVTVSICHWMWTHRKFGLSIIQQFRRWRQGYDLLAETLPDRMENSDRYHRGNLASFVSQPTAVDGRSHAVSNSPYQTL